MRNSNALVDSTGAPRAGDARVFCATAAPYESESLSDAATPTAAAKVRACCGALCGGAALTLPTPAPPSPAVPECAAPEPRVRLSGAAARHAATYYYARMRGCALLRLLWRCQPERRRLQLRWSAQRRSSGSRWVAPPRIKLLRIPARCLRRARGSKGAYVPPARKRRGVFLPPRWRAYNPLKRDNDTSETTFMHCPMYGSHAPALRQPLELRRSYTATGPTPQ